MDLTAEFSQSSGWSMSWRASPWLQMGYPWTSKNSAATDEEAEDFWSALESLQSSDHQRTVTSDEQPALYNYEDVEFTKMGPTDRRLFIDRILRTADEDNAAFLKKLRHRIDNVGIQLPTVEVRFENITVRAKCHIGTRALPTLLNESINLSESLFGLFGVRSTQMTKLNILNNISGIIRPSRMTLLLGPPSSGKTTLLLALAGKLQKSLEVSGVVTYNGYELNEFLPQKTAAYISQYDMHTGEMTVKETLSFSERCQGVGDRYELLSELARREKAKGIVPDPEVDLFMKATSIEGQQIGLQTDYTIRILGLDICSDTIVGDEMRRGISGGQKKRVTTGEMIVGPTKTLFMDEISTGLDSSTTHQVVKCFQQIVHLGEATILMSLLQPAPETFDLFDDIILLDEGQIIYQGPRDHVLEFFHSCGFRCPERKAIAEFLQEVTSRNDQQQYWENKEKPYEFMSAAEFIKRFNRFHVGIDLRSRLSVPFDKRKSHNAALVFTKRSAPTKVLLKASFTKEWLLIKRNSFVYVFRAIQLLILAFVASSVFLRTNMKTKTEADGAVYIGALVYGLNVNFFNEFAEQSLAISRLPVFYKQRDLLFYPTWVFTVPNCIVRIPLSIMESAVWVIVTYYSIGFAPEASRFFKQLLIFFLVQQMAAGLFRLVAGVTRSITAANTWGSVVSLTLISIGGFSLPKDLIPKWWMLGHWLSPLTHGFTALTINEMFSSKWMDKFAPDGRRLGIAILENIDLSTDQKLYWKSAGVLVGYSIIFNILFTLSLMFLNPLGRSNPVMPEETAAEMEDKRDHCVGDEAKAECSRPSSNTPKWRSCETYRNAAGKLSSRRGMVLPFKPLAMSFNEVNYYVDIPPAMKAYAVKEDRLQLLREITGTFRPGILTALMGESGAGKTTLMDVLAGRKTGGYIEGDIRLAGYPKKQSTFARISGYCEQFDVHSPQLTVKESLSFSALLRLAGISVEEKLKFVDEVMELVELDNLRDGLVGIPGITGLSTEQRKRLTIAVELVANPSIIFMDEPTSGLDARAAAIVMRTVRNTVNTGRTVVCTIHQPNIDIFESFDELLLLKRGGQVIYSGPLGQNSQKLIEYFEKIPGVQKINDGRNPAVWMMEASSTATEEKLDIDFAEIYKNSSLHKQNMALVGELSKPLSGTCDLYFSTRYAQSSYGQFKICVWKYWWIYWRSPGYNLSRLGMALVTALLLGSIFWKIGQRRDNSKELLSVIGAMFFAVQFVGFANCSTVQPLINTERLVFYREKAAGMYSALPYALSQVVVEIPYVLFQAFYYTLLVYYMMSFQWTATKFLWFLSIFFFSFLYFTYYGMLSVAVSPNLQVSGILSASIFFFFDLFSGFFIHRPEIPVWWIWYCWICPVSWTLYGLIVTQYGDIHDKIKVPGQEDQQIRDYVMNHFGYRDGYQSLMIVVLMGFAIFFAFMYTYCIRSCHFQQR
ncbi:ABC transporter G family member 42 isoform X1 [Dendrobium catenatum]|uniref:ABC transporter G family member 42 isoform X1 n=1 Tax=Dendrobium catenatum TaxID=906689 RepID=UPI0009F4AF56|nr:ABC transporter G family member 42 isoform X1 [Dendrobium catenatum]